MFCSFEGGREANTRRYTIGKHGSPWTAVTARTEAERLALLIAQGVDPVEADKQRRREAVDLAFSNYADRFASACKGRGWSVLVKRSFRIHIKPVLANKPLTKITRTDIVAVLDNMPSAQVANRRNVFAVLRRLFRWAVNRGDLERSPMEGMEAPPPVKARDRWLSDEELGRVWNQAHDWSAARRSGIASWEELDRSDRLWTLPGNRAKNGEPNRIPLNALAVCVLDRVAGGESWPRRGKIFSTSTGGSFTGYDKGKKKLDHLVGKDGGDPISPWRLHDLRRTLATGFQRLGVRFEVTQAVLNHVGGSRAGVAGIYQRHDWKKEKREALEQWNGHVAAILDKSNCGLPADQK